MSEESIDLNKTPEELAEEKGCYVFYPADNQLTIDIDTDSQYDLFLMRLQDLYKLLPGLEWQEIPSKSGHPHRHMLITCDERFSEAKRIALQFALGSDPVRETMNLWRSLKGDPRPTRFFQPKEDTK